MKNIYEERYSIFNELYPLYFPLNSKLKHSELWIKFIKFQTKCFLEQPINKVEKKFKFLQDLCFNKLLLSNVKTCRALAQRVKHKEFWLPVVLLLNFNIDV